MNNKLLLLVFLFACMNCQAKPIYLECEIKYKSDKDIETVKVDEDTGKITHTRNGYAFNTDGFFSANQISYKEVITSDRVSSMSLAYRIDRATLEIARDMIESVVGKSDKIESMGAGLCKLNATTKNKI